MGTRARVPLGYPSWDELAKAFRCPQEEEERCLKAADAVINVLGAKLRAVSECYKCGAAVQGTAPRGRCEVDIIVVFDKPITCSNLTEHIEILRTCLLRNLPGLHTVRRLHDHVSFQYRDFYFRCFPTCGPAGPINSPLAGSGGPMFPEPCRAPPSVPSPDGHSSHELDWDAALILDKRLQSRYMRHQSPICKDVMRIARMWLASLSWGGAHKPPGFLIECLVCCAYARRAGRAHTHHLVFCEFLRLVCEAELRPSLRLVMPECRHAPNWSAWPDDIPVVLDPVHGTTNVAASWAAYGTQLIEHAKEARLEMQPVLMLQVHAVCGFPKASCQHEVTAHFADGTNLSLTTDGPQIQALHDLHGLSPRWQSCSELMGSQSGPQRPHVARSSVTLVAVGVQEHSDVHAGNHIHAGGSLVPPTPPAAPSCHSIHPHGHSPLVVTTASLMSILTILLGLLATLLGSLGKTIERFQRFCSIVTGASGGKP
eukprot:jgi/Mesvir1/24108/Mv10829-RA.2